MCVLVLIRRSWRRLQIEHRLRHATVPLLLPGIGLLAVAALVALGFVGGKVAFFGLNVSVPTAWPQRLVPAALFVVGGIVPVILALIVGVPTPPQLPPLPPIEPCSRITKAIALIIAGVVLSTSANIVYRNFIKNDSYCPDGVPTVNGAVGSEKQGFFDRQQVIDAFGKHCLKVDVLSFGSRQIATIDFSRYDFVFPSSSPAAEKVQNIRKLPPEAVQRPFSSPMVIATFEKVAHLLERIGIASYDSSSRLWTFDVAEYLKIAGRLRWEEIRGNTSYRPKDKTVLVTTTDPRKSNSGAMYVAVVSYVLNKDAPVADRESYRRLMPRLFELFRQQGYMEDSSEFLFQKYLTYGIHFAPMVFVYEAQFVSRKPSELKPDMVMMYPSPTVEATHSVVALKPVGEKVGRLLGSDPELKKQAAAFGFRTLGGATPAASTQDGTSVPSTFSLELVPPPAYEFLEGMLSGIECEYKKRSDPSSAC